MATDMITARAISPGAVQNWKKAIHDAPLHHVIRNAIIKNGVQAVAQNRSRVAEMTYTFSDELAIGTITNQRQSGRCWIFAGLNVIRERMAKKIHVKDLELSQAYLMFYDKLEKANYFLESILGTMAEPTDGRLMGWLLMSPLQDGGQWDMFVNLVEKYGVVPKWMMPESFHSSNSRQMNQLMTSKLREDAAQLRLRAHQGASADDLLRIKEGMMADIYQMLSHFLGDPPEQFDFEYQDDDHHYHADRQISPVLFFERYGEMDLHDYVSVINAPTADKPFYQTYTVDYLGNVVGGNSVLYLNLPIDEFKELTKAQIVDGNPVWFGCDVGKMSERETGILDVAQFDYEIALGVTLSLSKADRLTFGESQMDHAMVLAGVNLVDGRPNRWKVENSWGKEAGHEGFFVMSDAWFDEYMYQVVVEKRYLSEAQRALLTMDPIHLPPWDPMGSLA